MCGVLYVMDLPLLWKWVNGSSFAMISLILSVYNYLYGAFWRADTEQSFEQTGCIH